MFDIAPQAPYLAILGDIGNIKDNGLFIFLEAQLQKFQIVFFLLGNHEPYHSNWATARKKKCKGFLPPLTRNERTRVSSWGSSCSWIRHATISPLILPFWAAYYIRGSPRAKKLMLALALMIFITARIGLLKPIAPSMRLTEHGLTIRFLIL